MVGTWAPSGDVSCGNTRYVPLYVCPLWTCGALRCSSVSDGLRPDGQRAVRLGPLRPDLQGRLPMMSGSVKCLSDRRKGVVRWARVHSGCRTQAPRDDAGVQFMISAPRAVSAWSRARLAFQPVGWPGAGSCCPLKGSCRTSTPASLVGVASRAAQCPAALIQAEPVRRTRWRSCSSQVWLDVSRVCCGSAAIVDGR